MMQGNRIKPRDGGQPIEIPPLKLSNITMPQTAVKLKASKEPITFLKNTGLDHNVDFLKEKSLYRYTISRKLSKTEMNKSQPFLRTVADEKKGRVDRVIENDSKNRTFTEVKEVSMISENSKEGQPRQRYFRRKTEVHQQSAYIRNPGRQRTGSVIKQEDIQEGSTFQNYQSKLSSSDKTIGASNQQQEQSRLKRELQTLKGQNKALRLKYEDKCKALEQMTVELNLMHEENQRLLLENKRLCPVNNEHFILDSKIENQLMMRDNLIKELQESIKYLELENCALKKVKIDNSRQSSQIYKLEAKNKELENRLKVLTTLRTKRGKMKGSVMSSCSEISLNLSVDDEELDKLYNVLMTTERTNKQSVKEDDSLLRHSMVEQMDRTQLSPWWGSKLKA